MANLQYVGLLAFCILMSQNLITETRAANGEYFVYVGTYTGAQSKGIYLFRLNTATGDLMPLGLAAETENPSFVALHPSGRYLYAVSEVSTFSGQKAGAVAAFGLDPKTGKLTLLNKASSGGSGPCHVVVDGTGKNVLVANYGGGSVAVLPVNPDGSLGEASCFIQHKGSSVNPARQKGPHAHCVTLSPDNKFVLVADLGLDEVLVYRLDAGRGLLTANDPPFARVNPGAGPRHIAFHQGGRFAYVINELESSVTAFAYDAAKGVLKDLGSVTTLPRDFSGDNSTAEIAFHPGGKFLYGSNRGHDSIAVFSVSTASGRLTPVEHVPTGGKVPRNFAVDPTGMYLLAANQKSDSITVFRIDRKTGRLTPTGAKLDVPSPVCIQYLAIR